MKKGSWSTILLYVLEKAAMLSAYSVSLLIQTAKLPTCIDRFVSGILPPYSYASSVRTLPTRVPWVPYILMVAAEAGVTALMEGQGVQSITGAQGETLPRTRLVRRSGALHTQCTLFIALSYAPLCP